MVPLHELRSRPVVYPAPRDGAVIKRFEQLDSDLYDLWEGLRNALDAMRRNKTMTTYRMADGSTVYDDYEFVTGPEWFEDCDDPTEVIKEVWRLESSQTLTFGPAPLTDEDAAE